MEYRKRTSREMRVQWEKMKLPTIAEKNAEMVWKTLAWATYDGQSSSHEGVTMNLAMEDDVFMEDQEGVRGGEGSQPGFGVGQW